MVTPRLCGLLPSQRVRPALPSEMLAWSRFDTCPMTARHARLGIVSVFGHEGRAGACGPDELAPLTLLHFHVVHERAQRNVAQRHRVAGLDVGVPTRDDLVADREPVWGEDVALLAVYVVKERDARRPVRIVFDRRDAGRNADLVAAPV